MKRARRWMLGVLVAGACGFLVVAVDELVAGPLQRVDRLVNDAVSEEVAEGEPLHLTGEIMSLPGSGVVVAPLVFACSAWMLWRGARALAGWCAGIGLATVGIIVFLKEAFESPRPPLLEQTLSSYSFPSGHTFAATATLGACIVLATEVLLRRHPLPPRWVPFAWATALVAWATLAAVTGVGRILAQDHWVSDVIASWCLGVVLVSAVLFVLSKDARGGDRGPSVPETVDPGPARAT